MGEHNQMTNDTQTITKYDRIYGGLLDVCLATKASTVKIVQAITGKSESFIVQTFRHPELGDFIFIEHLDEDGVTRTALPPKVCNLIASQKDSLTKTGRSIRGRRSMAERMANGYVPTFAKKNGRKKKA
jgi:hypothetical protein